MARTKPGALLACALLVAWSGSSSAGNQPAVASFAVTAEVVYPCLVAVAGPERGLDARRAPASSLVTRQHCDQDGEPEDLATVTTKDYPDGHTKVTVEF